MNRRAVGGILLAAFSVLVVGCSTETSVIVTTAATDRAHVRLPDFDSPEQLDEALVSFGKCVEQQFPIAMRYRTDAFIGLETSVGSLREEDGDRVDDTVAECMGEFDLDRRLSAFQIEHEISLADHRRLVEEFVSCASAISSEMSELISEASLTSISAVSMFVADLGVSTGSDLVAVGTCQSEMTGPLRVFDEGHPWFIP